MHRRFYCSSASSSAYAAAVTLRNSRRASSSSSSSSFGGGENSVLGTNTLSPSFLEGFREDVLEQEMMARQERQVGGIFASCIRKSELDHMDCPETDARHLNKIGKQVDDLFSKLPAQTPEEALKAARAPDAQEVEEIEKFEALKDHMREKYQTQQRRKEHEKNRIDAAMKAVQSGTYDAAYAKKRPTMDEEEAAKNRKLATDPKVVENITLMQELEAAKQQMREMQKQLDELKKSTKK